MSLLQLTLVLWSLRVVVNKKRAFQVHFYIPTFTEARQHLRLGQPYRMSAYESLTSGTCHMACDGLLPEPPADGRPAELGAPSNLVCLRRFGVVLRAAASSAADASERVMAHQEGDQRGDDGGAGGGV